MRVSYGLLATLLLLLPACDATSDPVGVATEEHPVFAVVSDGGHGGSEGFYFLGPIVEGATWSGTFDAAASPVVEVCVSTDCSAPLHASFSMTEGIGSDLVRVDEELEQYVVNWNTGSTGAEDGTTYRIRVLQGGVELGYADVTVFASGRDAAKARKSGAIAVVAGQTLPVAFRIEEAEPPPSIAVEYTTTGSFGGACSGSTCTVGGITIVYNAAGSNGLPVIAPSPISFGSFQTTGATTSGSISVPFTLTITQTAPTAGAGSFQAATLAGTLTVNSSTTTLTAIDEAVLIGPATYSWRSVSYAIVPPDVDAGAGLGTTTLLGQVE